MEQIKRVCVDSPMVSLESIYIITETKGEVKWPYYWKTYYNIIKSYLFKFN